MNKALVLAGFMALTLVGSFGIQTASAIDLIDCSGANANSTVCKSKDDNAGQMVVNIVNMLLFVLGVVGVIVIIIGGFMYVTSAGDANRAKTGKDTIMYAVIGLIVALMAFAIVNWVATRVGANSSSPQPAPSGINRP